MNKLILYCLMEQKHKHNTRRQYMDVLLISVDALKADSFIDENVDDKTIRIDVKFVQDSVVEKCIGSCMLHHIQELISTGCICEEQNQCYKDLLDFYIRDIFIWGVPADISIPLSFKQRNMGVIRTTDDNIQSSALSEIRYLNSYYGNKMDVYIKRLQDHLCCSRDCYPELCGSCGCGCCHTLYGSKQFQSPLNLRNTNQKQVRLYGGN